MPRKPRIYCSSGIYHIVLRSVNQQLIFEEDLDYLKFLFVLSDCKEKYGIDIYAYCLMGNHIHLLLHSPQEALAGFFQSLGARFVRWYNKKYQRTGHLFQERYHSFAVESTDYYLNTLIYIHNNPVKAGVCRFPSEYRWSSYCTFYGQKNALIDVAFSENLVGSRQFLQQYFADHEMDDPASHGIKEEENAEPKHLFTDTEVQEILKELADTSSINAARMLNKTERNKLISALHATGVTFKQISRLLGISVITVQRICKK